MIEVRTQSEQDTIALGKAIGAVLKDGAVLALEGDLGAGKTHFVQGIAAGMGITDVVSSPTFTIMNYYEHTVPLQHFDFYRLESEYELDDLGFDEYLSSGITVIEWSEKFPDRLPASAAIVRIIKTGVNDRLFRFDFPDDTWKYLENEVNHYVVSH
jgi:tRNA threonylcarbamoyladenosine biosynthesis protein TsaE